MNNRFEVHIQAAGFTDSGPVRGENQDVILLPGLIGTGNEVFLNWEKKLQDEAASFAVIDGMGGYEGGRDAAAFCAAYLSGRRVPSRDSEANEMLSDLSRGIAAIGEVFGTPRMGAAIAFMTILEGEAFFANAGDCRIYCLLGNSMGQVTVDDRIDAESPGITQAVGPTEKPDAHYYSQVLRPGDQRFLLCTDGVWGTLGNEALKQLAIANSPLEDICSGIKKKLYELSASDNCSLVLIETTLIE